MRENSRERKMSPTETIRNLDVSPYPEHLGGNRLLMVLDILEHEEKKNFTQTVKGIEEERIKTNDKLIDPMSRAVVLRDVYNKLYGVMEVSKLKGGFTENISAENIKVIEEKVDLKDVYFMPYFITKVLKIEGGNGQMNGQQILEYYQDSTHHQDILDEMSLSDQSFGGQNMGREEDRIILRFDENGKYVIYDGNGRFMRKLSKFILDGKPIDDVKIDAWVLKGNNEPLKNFWVPTSKLADLMKLAVENPELKESVKQIIVHIFNQSPICSNIELDRAAQMSEYKEGASSTYDLLKEIRQDTDKTKHIKH